MSRKMSRLLVTGGHSVLVPGNFDSTYVLAGATGHSEYGIAVAAERADFIILTTPTGIVREVAYQLGDVRDKVIIDMSCSISSESADRTNTANAIQTITGSPHVVKVLNIKGYEQYFQPLFGGQRPQLLIAGDSYKAKKLARIAMRDCDITEIYDFGGNSTFALFDEVARMCRNMMATHTVR